jgi:hypothetical protein
MTTENVSPTTSEAQFACGNVVVVNMQDPSFAGQANPYNIQTICA